MFTFGKTAIILAFLLVSAHYAHAGNTGVFTHWDLPDSTTNLDSIKGNVMISADVKVVEVQCVFSYPNGDSGKVACKEVKGKPRNYQFTVPAKEDGGVGDISLNIEVLRSAADSKPLTSEVQKIPMAYEEDLEITANPPEVLFFDLVSPEYQVRYNPCCNILGASVVAKRLAKNPVPSEVGLPKMLLSDFIHLEPDDLSASTAGLYFTFTFDSEKGKSSGQDVPALYEYDMRKKEWFSSPNFNVVDGNKIDLHCPAGGFFVLGKTR